MVLEPSKEKWKVNMVDWKLRYKTAYEAYQLKTYPSSSKDFGTLQVKWPDITKSNGLTNMILNYLKWNGWRATRVNTMGRLIDAPEKQESGISLITKKYIHSSTRKGTADISATIKGRSVMIEVKVGRDKPRESQLEEQERERLAGGIYEFIYTPDGFLELYDKIINNQI